MTALKTDRRRFNKCLAAAAFTGAVYKPRLGAKAPIPLGKARTVFDPPDLDADPMLVRPMPVRVTQTRAHLHMILAADAEVRVAWREQGSGRWNGTKYSTSGFTPLLVPLELEEGGVYEWRARWRPTGSKAWAGICGSTLRALKGKGTAAKIVIVGDTHANIEGLYERRRGGISYGNLEGYFGSLFGLIAAEAPDLVVFSGDDVGMDSRYLWSRKRYTYMPRMDKAERAFVLYRLWRQTLGVHLGGLPFLQVIGNHDGLNGFEPDLYGWSAVAKKIFLPQHLPGDSPLGGEDGFDLFGPESFAGAVNGSPLENYFGVRCGNADLMVLDVMGYTCRKPPRVPSSPRRWTYGERQKDWLREALAADNKWKILVTHHLAGGSPYGPRGQQDGRAYGRGGARYAGVGEQAEINSMLAEAAHGDAGVIHSSAHDHNWWHDQVDSSAAIVPASAHGAYAAREGAVYFGNGSPSHVPTWPLLDFHNEMYRQRDVVAKGFVVVETAARSASVRYVRCGLPGRNFLDEPETEFRAPDAAVGQDLDRFTIQR